MNTRRLIKGRFTKTDVTTPGVYIRYTNVARNVRHQHVRKRGDYGTEHQPTAS